MTDAWRTFTYRVEFQVRSRLSRYPRLLAAWMGLRNPAAAFGQFARTDLVLEGYPRSGNWFAYYALMLAQKEIYQVAHHSHLASTVITATRMGLPALVLIRQPEEVVISFCVFQPRLTLGLALQGWMRFYQALLPCRSGLVMAPFEQVTADYGQVIAAVNERFGTQFEPFEHTQENVRGVFAQIEAGFEREARRAGKLATVEDRVGRPSAEREAKKARLRQALAQDSELQRRLAQAEALYRAWTEADGRR